MPQFFTGKVRMPHGNGSKIKTGPVHVDSSAPPANTGQLWYDTSVSGGIAGLLTVVTKTANYTATDQDQVILCDASGGAFTITLPTAVGRPGRGYQIKKIDSSANAVTIDGDGAETIDNIASQLLTYPMTALTIVGDNAEWWIQ